MKIPLKVISVCLAALIDYDCRAASTAPCENAAVLEQFRSNLSTLIGASPDGTRIVARAKYSDGTEREGLIVRAAGLPAQQQAGSQSIIRSMRTADSVLRVNWRPDGRAISYFLQAAGTNVRRLFVWELDADRHREIPIPVSHFQALIRWSPDGSHLAFTSDPGGFYMVDLLRGAVAVYEQRVRAFDWSSDSRRIAVISGEEREPWSVDMLDPATGAVVESIAPRAEGTLRQVAWQGSARLLLTTRADDPQAGDPAATFRLMSLEPETQREEILYSAPTDIENPMWVAGGTGRLWQQQDREGKRKIMISSNRLAEPRRVELDGAQHFPTPLADAKSMVVLNALPDAEQLIRIPLDSDRPAAVLAEHRFGRIPGGTHESVLVRSADGAIIPIQVESFAQGTSHANAVIIRLHHGPVAAKRQTQLYLAHGVQIIHVANRRPHGAEDLLTACEYARKTLKVPRERIVVFGASDAAGIAVATAMQHPEKMGLLAVIGLLGLPRNADVSRATANSAPGLAALRFFGFHGETDRYAPPEHARQVLEDALGPEAVVPPRGLWHVFPGEDHALRLDRSHAAVHATILHALGLIECNWK